MEEFVTTIQSSDNTKLITIEPRCEILGRGTRVSGNSQMTIVFLGSFQHRVNASEAWSVPIKVAVKRVQLREAKSKENQRELTHLLQLGHHPNVVQLHHYDDFGDFRYFALELCTASLHDYCTNKETEQKIGPLKEPKIMLQIAQGLEHVHSSRLAHRNIHPKNILLLLPHQHGEATVKIADFGLCKPVSQGGSVSHSQDHPGGEAFRAPELLDDDLNDEAFSEKKGYLASDIFSIGCVFFFFLARVNLFGSGTLVQSNIITGNTVNWKKLATVYQELFGELIRDMTRQVPDERIAIDQVVERLKLNIGVSKDLLEAAGDYDFMQ